MLVSHRYRFIYTKTSKSGGTSVESFFEPFCMPAGEWEQSHQREEHDSDAGIVGYRGPDHPREHVWFNHMHAKPLRERLNERFGEQLWNDYYKFCVIRNPYERCVSAFQYFGHKGHKPAGVEPESNAQTEPVDGSLTEEQRLFLDYVTNRPPIDRNTYTIDGAFCLDDVIRHERMQADLERVCAKLGVPFDAAQLPEFKKADAQTRDPARRAALFSQAAIEQVERHFAYEIERFGYTFPF
ncbi:MAG: sulfotransferase family 2 domain-containing protein [Planctomycetota bacterium]